MSSSYNDMEAIKSQLNIRYVGLNKDISHLNRFRVRIPDFELENSIGYVFFTKPDLNILDESGNFLEQTKKRPEFHDVMNTDPFLFKSLKSNQQGSFINILCNRAENFETSDETIKTRTTGETQNDWKIAYGGRDHESRAAGTFNIGYTDDRNISIYKLHKIWKDYIHLISMGYIEPSDYNRYKMVLDYACSVYFFLTEEDGESIVFYTKYVGVFPTNIPSSVFSWSKGESKKLNYQIQYQYSFKRDMDPLIIKDFNIAAGTSNQYEPMYNKDAGVMGNTWVSSAFIENKGRKHILRFRK